MIDVPAWFEPPLCDPARVMGWIANEAIDAAQLRRLKSSAEALSAVTGLPVAQIDKWFACKHSGSDEMKAKFREMYGLDWYCGHLYKMFGSRLAPKRK